MLRYEFSPAARVTPFSDFKQVDRAEFDLSEKRPLIVSTHSDLVSSSERISVHYALELGVLSAGKMTRVYPAHQRELVAGDVWLCGPWEPHGFQVQGDPCSAVVVSIFPPMLATSMFAEIPALDWMEHFMLPPGERPALPIPSRSVALELAHELTKSQELDEPRRWIVQRLLVYQILLLLPRPEARDSRPPFADDYARVHPAIELVLRSKRYIKSGEAAQACGMTVRTFSRAFQRVAGVSFHAFTARHRMQGAALQLLETADPIKTIAHAWGFFDASHFHQAFRAVYGCSPAHYRRTSFL